MHERIDTAARTGFIVLALFLVGCGGDDTPVAPPMLSAPATLSAPPRDALPFDIDGLSRAPVLSLEIEVTLATPAIGPIAGGQPVTITGKFPIAASIAGAAQAYATYGVYFGTNRATFDDSFNPVLTATTMYVTTPPGDALGLVPVVVVDAIYDPAPFNALLDGYEYVDNFSILEVDPDFGPLSGNQFVKVIGFFPIAANISTAAQAYAAYRVYFDGVLADFNPVFDPVITAECMYVITPPGNRPGLVNVSVFDIINLLYDPIASVRVLNNGYDYVGDLALDEVDPTVGFVFGMEPVTLRGIFPVTTAFSLYATAAEVSEAFTVYFDNDIAEFNSAVFPIISAEELFVISPVPRDVGPVDVSVLSRADGIYVQLSNAYRYYSMLIHEVVPPSGPIEGGNGVEIRGLFLTDAIYDIYRAEQLYTVFFGANQATFEITEPFLTPITAASIDIIAKTYISNRLYMFVPPGDDFGFVDLQVISDLGKEPRAIARNAYEYTSDVGVGLWFDASISPNPVGKVPAGDLLVEITVSGEISDDTIIFIVPQGGDPKNPEHRLVLEQDGEVETTDDATIWRGTNTSSISTFMNGDGILMDGHAAIYILEGTNADNILGGDFNDIDEGGRIRESAQQGRHCIIDTIPPRMRVNGGLSGEDFIGSDPSLTLSDQFTTLDITPDSIIHPFTPPGSGIIANENVPWDQSFLTGPPALSNDRAQLFYNVGSVTNDFPREDLAFHLFVDFEDISVYDALGLPDRPDPNPDPIANIDIDRFTGSTERQRSGFDLAPTAPAVGGVESAVRTGDRVLIQWDFQSSASGVPEIDGITTTYESSDLDETVDATSTLSSNLDAANMVLSGFWEADPGVPFSGENLLMPIVFRAVDRAGDYFPRGDDSRPKRKVFTEDDSIAGVLNLWWLVNTGTRFVDTNIPGSENTRTPNFIWKNSSLEDPKTEPEPERLFNYKLFFVDPIEGLSREDARDGPYTLHKDWNGWTPKTTLTTGEIDQVEGTWMLLVVIAADEAGNVEQWPVDDLLASTDGITPDGTTEVVTVIGNSGSPSQSNWRRWFVPPAAQVIDTQAEPTFWHDFFGSNETIDSGDRIVGKNIEIVPLPARNSGGTVSVSFEVEVIPDPSVEATNFAVRFELFKDGAGPGEFERDLIADRFITLTFDNLGDPITRRPVHYVFRATGIVNLDEPNEVVDSTPVNFSFVVVDNIVEFIENRRSSDEQPIKELDRP